MFKTWQIFMFSLVPLALVFTGVILGSIHFKGEDSRKEIFPTPAPRSASAPGPGAGGPPPPPGTSSLQLTARNLLYDKRTLSAPPGPVQLLFDNQDAGTLHDFALYTNNRATTKIFGGELTTGPSQTTYRFTAPAPGTYFFRCDVHPDTMTGTFTSR